MSCLADKIPAKTPDVQRKNVGSPFFTNSGENAFFRAKGNSGHMQRQIKPNDAGVGEVPEVEQPQAQPIQQPQQQQAQQPIQNDPEQLQSSAPIIGSIKLVKDATGADTGFLPATCCGASESAPGPYNDIANGPIANSHQIRFTLSSGKSSELAVTRMTKRTATRGGQPFNKDGNDGPPPDEIRRPDQQTLVVADAPGWCVGSPTTPTAACGPKLQASDFPLTYNADFILAAYDQVTKKTSSINYKVAISKNSISDATATNTVTEVSQKV